MEESERKASLLAEKWERQTRQAETTITELRLELSDSNSEMIRLKERADSLERSLQEVSLVHCNVPTMNLSVMLISKRFLA